jgi:protein TonB
MRQSGSERRLKWALVAALLLHGAALAAAARLPLPTTRNGSLEEIQVFDAAASPTDTPVTLVDLSAPSPFPRETRNKSSVEPVTITAPSDLHSPTVAPRPRVTPVEPRAVARPKPTRAVAGTSGGTKAPASTGGGGGGPLDVGSASANGTVSLPAAATEGGTGLGQAPGQGSGVGSGEGSGRGGGTGSGSGGGEGAGVGSGRGGGGGTAEGAGPGFTSRLANRAEPEVIRKGRLAYPEAAIRDGAEGTCVLKVLVSETGEVVEMEVSKSSGDRRLDQAAMGFVRQWRYRPAVQDGKPRRVYTRATVQFELK